MLLRMLLRMLLHNVLSQFLAAFPAFGGKASFALRFRTKTTCFQAPAPCARHLRGALPCRRDNPHGGPGTGSRWQGARSRHLKQNLGKSTARTSRTATSRPFTGTNRTGSPSRLPSAGARCTRPTSCVSRGRFSSLKGLIWPLAPSHSMARMMELVKPLEGSGPSPRRKCNGKIADIFPLDGSPMSPQSRMKA